MFNEPYRNCFIKYTILGHDEVNVVFVAGRRWQEWLWLFTVLLFFICSYLLFDQNWCSSRIDEWFAIHIMEVFCWLRRFAFHSLCARAYCQVQQVPSTKRHSRNLYFRKRMENHYLFLFACCRQKHNGTKQNKISTFFFSLFLPIEMNGNHLASGYIGCNVMSEAYFA